jgi:hypothetical protein
VRILQDVKQQVKHIPLPSQQRRPSPTANSGCKNKEGTKKGLENLGIFLINTEIATRKWILDDVDDENEEENE